MPPKSKLDLAAFEKMRRIAPPLLAARREHESHAPFPLPQEIAFKLTNRCDLRCSHCYQWNEQGYHHGLGGGDLDLAIVEKVLVATRPVKSNVYLWGGEPLVYRHWNALADLLAKEGRWTSICTNGTMIERRFDSLLRMSGQLELVIAVDGFEAEHDLLRGRGSHQRMIAGLRALVRAKREGRYRGEITVNCVIQDSMIGYLHLLAAALQDEGIDTLYISFPWYLSEATSAQMDAHVANHFPWIAAGAAETKTSWHSYKFHLDPAKAETLRVDLDRINTTSWQLKLRYNPELDVEDMDEFLSGSGRPAQRKTRCVVHRTRMDVFPDGKVVSCKFFPEFAVGNIKEADVETIWHGERFNAVRDTIARCGLMPVCAKCNLLYTRGL